MDTEIKPSKLEFTGSAWPARLGGASIFMCTMGVFFYFPNIPLFVPVISFVFMLIAVLFAADETLTADNSLRTLTLIKKRIFGSSQVVYPYVDICFLCQVITTSVNQKGESIKSNGYAIGLNSQTTTMQPNYQGRRLIPITIPKSSFSVVSVFAGSAIEFTRAKLLADFIGVPLYIQGGEHDTLTNIQEDIPKYIEEVQKLPETITQIKDVMAQAKIENDKVAQEILNNQKR